MSAHAVFPDLAAFARHLKKIRSARARRVATQKAAGPRRLALTKAQRAYILLKSGGRYHICGGPIQGHNWQADHVLARSAGGQPSVDNYLPAHSLCNNYRWHYDSEEFQWILKLGVWLRTQVEHPTQLGLAAAADFLAHERRRVARCKQRP